MTRQKNERSYRHLPKGGSTSITPEKLFEISMQNTPQLRWVLWNNFTTAGWCVSFCFRWSHRRKSAGNWVSRCPSKWLHREKRTFHPEDDRNIPIFMQCFIIIATSDEKKLDFMFKTSFQWQTLNRECAVSVWSGFLDTIILRLLKKIIHRNAADSEVSWQHEARSENVVSGVHATIILFTRLDLARKCKSITKFIHHSCEEFMFCALFYNW